MLKCLYLTNDKPARKSAQEFAAWLKANYPDCSFSEVNVGTKQTHPGENGGRYQGRVDGPAEWAEEARTADRLVVLDTARRMLGS